MDLSIHESIFMPDMAMAEVEVLGRGGHKCHDEDPCEPAFFGKVMAMTRPKHAVAYHFENDFDTLPVVMRTVERVYDGPVDYAQGLHGVERDQGWCTHTDGGPQSGVLPDALAS